MQKIFVLFYLMVFTVCYSHAQIENQKQDQNLKIGVSVQLNSILNDENYAIGDGIGYVIQKHKKYFSFAADIEYVISDKFSLLSGLSYTYRKFDGQWYCAVCNWVGPWPEPEQFKQQFLAVPATVRYYIFNQRTQLFGEAGVLNQFTLTNELDEKKYLLKGYLGTGIGYHIWKRMLIELSVNYQPAFDKLYSNSNYKYQILAFKLGLKWPL